MQTLVRSLLMVIGAATAVSAFASIGGHAPERVEVKALRALPTLLIPDTVYEMSNGHTLRLRSFGDFLEMRYAGRAARVLKHAGQGRFVSADGRFALLFDFDVHGQAQLRQMSLPGERP